MTTRPDAIGRLPASEPPATTAADVDEVATDTLRELTSLFARSIRRLGQAGQVEEASRLGGKAFVLLMRRAPESAEHVNGVMHYLARLPQKPLGEDASCR